MDMLLAIPAVGFYLIALLLVIPGLANNNGIKVTPVFAAACMAIIFHILLLKDLIFAGAGQNLSILNVASLISVIIACLTTVAMLKMRIWFLLPVIYSFAAINLAASALLPGAFITHLEAHPQVLLHISLALFSYSTLTIASLYAIQLAWLDHKLKHKKSLAMNPNIPPLMMVERQLFKIIIVGYALLTVTLLTGYLFINDIIAQGKTHKAILSLLAWGVYSVLLWGHYQKGWRGRRVIWFSLVGAFLLTLAYFGSRFVKEIIIGM
ncbi:MULTISPECIES: inner membrane protein YpjD [unclassified Photobacterium]|uniref:cytochrome C assembly family protein n=1 Tax=unclassified Photobacterium TaxID=2628852 RepID=UPI000D17A052|nr:MULTISPECIES: inner membrane protein YpjD [unclassified Photobacterium]PSV22349.1 chromosome partitioning protein ParB [Photobacterium sp. GB-56]PSV26739.1 chromosome partitioning protein ParB [Photobacterium sp. GB-72]PSV31601.1 chromosome partitioning protein ParB [Photobacterium sp. GB-27]PSV32793.1 chromosome partitioning protein ParB [Photobacterium sp. GB-210]PSV50385.1 chromosome partitioning protein ParB [Photobacterium sp. GB-1]